MFFGIGLIIMMSVASAFPSGILIQPEPGIQAEKSTISNASSEIDKSALLIPERLKNSEPEARDQSGNSPEEKEKYKPSADGEGDKKIR
jgi:hypothetical protein